MIRAYFDDLARGLEAKLASASPDEPIARKRLTLELARLGIRLFSPDEKVAWCGVLAPFDLLNALGVTSCFVEFVGAMLASTGSIEPILAAAEQAGYSTDSCSYHRSVLGANVQGLMPRPHLAIATSAPCSGGLAVIENLARHHGRDIFVLHVPQRDDPRAVDHLAGQLRELTGFVARRMGVAPDPARLRSAIQCTNQMRELLLEVYALTRTVPSPARPRDLVNFAVVMSLLLGTETGVEVARTYRDEFARKVARGPRAEATSHPVRLMWLQNRIQFRNPLDEVLDRDLGAAIVVDELNDITWGPIDPEDPYPGLAKRMLSISFVGPAERRIANLKRLARDYGVDGAINPCHWGCRQGSGARGLIEASLREVGVPVLNLEVDCVDPRSYAEGQLRTRLEAFVEMLRDRPRRA